MILFQKYQEYTNFPFPKHDIDPALKNKDWCLEFTKALFARYVGDRTGISSSDSEKFSELRAYGQGEQSIDKYETMLNGKKNSGEKAAKSFININKEIFSPAPKFKGYLRQRYKPLSLKPTVKAIDEKSGMERKDMETLSQFYMQESEFIEQAEKVIGSDPEKPQFIPSSMEELEAYKQVGGFKAKSEIAYNYAITYTELISRFGDIADKMLDDIADINICVAKDYVNEEDGKVYSKYIDPARFIGFYSRNENFSKSPGFAHFEDYTIAQLRQETTIPEETLEGIAKLYGGYQGNGEQSKDIQYDDNKWAYDDIRVIVLESEFLTVDSKYQIKHTSKKGEVRYFDANYGIIKDTETKKTTISKVKMWYQSKWIIGTDHIWNTGKVMDVSRPNKAEPRSSYHAWKIPGKSFIQSIIVSLDQIQLAKIKMENALARAAPDGLAIEYGSLENINLGDGDLKPIDLLRIRRAQGDLIYKATTHRGHFQGSSAKPITEIKGGAGTMLTEAIQMMELHFNLIAEITGIDRNSIGVLPNAETSATATAQAAGGTGLIVLDMAQALNKVRESLCINYIHRIALRVKHSKKIYNVYHPALGTSTLDILKLSADMTPDEMGIEMKSQPSDQDKKDIHETALASLRQKESGAPGLEYPDYLFIKEQINQGNIDYARAFLGMKMQKAVEKHDKTTMMKQDNQAKGNAEAGKAIEQAKQATIAAEAEAKIKVNAEQEKEKRETIKLQEKEKRETAIELAYINAQNTLAGKMIDDDATKKQQQGALST